MPKDLYIVGAVRTPIGKFGGSLAGLTAVDLGVTAAKAAMARAGVDPTLVCESYIGHGRRAGCGPYSARQVAIRPEIPSSRPAITGNGACASGMRAISLPCLAIQSGESESA